MFTIRASADQEFRRKPDWQAVLAARVRSASDAFQQFQIRWELQSANEWVTDPAVRNPELLRRSLFEDVPTTPDILLGITGLPHNEKQLGAAFPFSRVIIVYDHPDRPEPENAAIVAGQLAVALGAWESPQMGLVPVRFDAPTDALFRITRNVDFHRGVSSFDAAAQKQIADVFAGAKLPAGQNPLLRAHMGLGTDLLNAGNLPRAEAEFQEAIKVDGANAGARYNLSAVLLLMRLPAEAEAQLREAVRLDPQSGRVHRALGVTLARRANYPAAVAELRKAVQLDPSDATGHLSLGNALVNSGERNAGLAEIKESLRLDPKSAAAQASLQRALAAKKN